MHETQSDLVAIADTGFVSSQVPVASKLGSAFKPMRYVRRYPLPAALTAVILLLLGGLVLRVYLRSVYSAQSIVYISPNLPTGLTETHDHDRIYEDFINQQITAVTRRSNLQNAVHKFHGFWMLPNENEGDAIARLEKSLKVQQMSRGYQMSITLQSSHPNQLADFVNEITSGYLEEAHKDEFFGQQERISALTAKRAQLTSSLDATLHEQDQLLRELGMAQYDAKASNPYDSQLQKLRDQLSDAHGKRAAADADAHAALSRTTTSTTSALDDLAASQIYNDPGVSAEVTQLNNRRAVLFTQLNGLTPQNPLYTEAQSELAALDRQLDSLKAKATGTAVGQLTHKLSSNRQSATLLENSLTSDLKQTQTLAQKAATKLLRAQVLSNDIDRIELSYAQIDQRINSLLLDSNTPGSEHIVSWATHPSSPVAKHTIIYMFGLFLFSIAGAFAAAYVTDLFDPNIYSVSDVQRLIGFPPIGMLLDETDFSSTMQSEYLIRIAGGIDHAHRRTGARSFLFTSAGEGDTDSVVSDLGAQLAATGLRTLVIVAGDPTPKEEQPSTAVSAAQAESLLVSRSQKRGEAFALPDAKVSDRGMLSVVTESRQQLAESVRRANPLYDITLISGEPLLSSAHTEHLARIADGTVLIAESGKVTKQQLGRAARLLERLKVAGVAVVLSQVTRDRAEDDLLTNAEEYSRDRRHTSSLESSTAATRKA